MGNGLLEVDSKDLLVTAVKFRGSKIISNIFLIMMLYPVVLLLTNIKCRKFCAICAV